MPSKLRTLLYFLLAVLLASTLGSVLQTQFNLVHGSDSPESAEREIGIFFGA